MTGLVLAGTFEARQICLRLFEHKVDAIASLAGVTRTPDSLGLKTRTAGFGGQDGFEKYLRDYEIKWVLDATHPFAANMTSTASKVCSALKLPYLIVQRPEWQATAGDKWSMIDGVSELMDLIDVGSTVFLGTGRQTLDQFGVLTDRQILCRVIDTPSVEFPLDNGEYLIGRPPFSVQEEVELLTDRNVDWVVVKNSGGSGGFSKLLAARQLGLPVGMFKRPSLPDAQCVQDVDDAIAWVIGQIDAD